MKDQKIYKKENVTYVFECGDFHHIIDRDMLIEMINAIIDNSIVLFPETKVYINFVYFSSFDDFDVYIYDSFDNYNDILDKDGINHHTLAKVSQRTKKELENDIIDKLIAIEKAYNV